MSRRDNWNGMNWIRQEKRLAIYIRDNFTCQHCDLDLKAIQPEDADRRVRIELDHITPVSKGGSNHQTNLITCCSACNLARSNKDFGPSTLAVVRDQAMRDINVSLAKEILAQKKANNG